MVSYRWSCILGKCTWTFSCQKERSSKNRHLLQWNWQILEDLADCFLLKVFHQHPLDLVCHLLEMHLAPLCPHLLKDIIKHKIKTKPKKNNLEYTTINPNQSHWHHNVPSTLYLHLHLHNFVKHEVKWNWSSYSTILFIPRASFFWLGLGQAQF